jgi:GNAT superfamily N-acetyltransferase
MIDMAQALTLRLAEPGDIARLDEMIRDSARALGEGFYSAAETEAAIAHVFGVDSELVADGTYLVIESAGENGGELAGCGGWSRRKTLFGGDNFAGRESGLLDPATDAAKIRAFFVAPAFARRGVARMLLCACEERALAAGFTRLELMATLPGVPFYTACGFTGDTPATLHLGGTAVRFIPMTKTIGEGPDGATD